MRPRALLLVAAVALVAAACGDSGTTTTAAPSGPTADTPIAVVASTDLATGTERLLLALTTLGNERLGGPDLAVTFRVFPAERPDDAAEYAATWMWATPEVSGLYRADVELTAPGVWAAQVVPAGGDPTEPVVFQVKEEPSTPAVGTPAPASETPTAAAVADLAAITTDLDPDPAFYELSVADAVASGRPTVVVFATPRFCQTAICGPTLDTIKDYAAGRPGVNFVHVEVFTNLDDPENLELVPAVAEWGLTSEPWIFVVAADGTVAAKFEGVATPEELDHALSS